MYPPIRRSRPVPEALTIAPAPRTRIDAGPYSRLRMDANANGVTGGINRHKVVTNSERALCFARAPGVGIVSGARTRDGVPAVAPPHRCRTLLPCARRCSSCTNDSTTRAQTMTEPTPSRRRPARPARPAPPNAAGAGLLLVSAIVLCAAIGAALGALIGAFPLFFIAGVFAGIASGTWVVYRRFRDL